MPTLLSMRHDLTNVDKIKAMDISLSRFYFAQAFNFVRDALLRIDYVLLFLLVVLASIGLLTLYSSSDHSIDLVWRQSQRLFVGFVLLFVLASISPATYRRGAIPLYLIGVILLFLVLFAGEASKGAQRWLNLWLVTFQPSEVLKFATPLLLCAIFASRPKHPPSFIWILLAALVLALPVGLVVMQPDLGTGVLICVSGLLVIFLAGIRWRWIVLAIVPIIVLAPAIWHSLEDYQQKRIEVFLDPAGDPTGAGYHIIQSKIAIGSGGLWGKGWLNGTQAQLGFVPEHSTDFVFAVFSEEFGFMGACLLVLIYLAIAIRGAIITLNASDYFSRLLAGSLTFSFSVYFLINLGMVSGLLPVVGVPLPLMSYGGSSVATLLASFGMLMSVIRYRPTMSHV